MRNFLLLLICLIAVSSCRVVSRQQAGHVQSVAKGIHTGATIPADFARQYYGISIECNEALASIITNPADKISQLKSVIDDRQEADKVIREYTAGYNVLNKYADLLLALTDTGYLSSLYSQKDAFVPVFDTLVVKYNTFNPGNHLPMASLGSLVSNLIQEVGARRIRYLQRKYLKALVTQADPVIAHICDQYKLIDFYKNNRQLATLNTTIDENYRTIIKFINQSGRSDPYSFYRSYDPIYLNWKNKVACLDEFNSCNLGSMMRIERAHSQLKAMLNSKTPAVELAKNIRDLYASVTVMETCYKRFQSDLTPTAAKANDKN